MDAEHRIRRRILSIRQRIEDVEAIKSAAMETPSGRGLTAAVSASNQLNKLTAALDDALDDLDLHLEDDAPMSDEELVAAAVAELHPIPPAMLEAILQGLVDAGRGDVLRRVAPPPLQVVGGRDR